MKLLKFFAFFTTVIFIACQGASEQSVQQSVPKQSTAELRETLINSNKQRIKDETEIINAYIDRKGYKMEKTQTGVRIMMLNAGSGERPRLLSDVKLNYRIELLDGSYVYSSDSSGVLSMVLGQSEEPSGLQEAILMMNEGSKALLIVPSYMAYGITGDGDKISSGESLVYIVELLKVKNN